MATERPTALYRAFDAEGALLYVGISFNPLLRVGQHAKSKAWWTEVAKITVAHYPTRAAAAAAERSAIASERPRHNVQHAQRERCFCGSTWRHQIIGGGLLCSDTCEERGWADFQAREDEKVAQRRAARLAKREAAKALPPVGVVRLRGVPNPVLTAIRAAHKHALERQAGESAVTVDLVRHLGDRMPWDPA